MARKMSGDLLVIYLPFKNGDLLGFNHYFDGDLMVKNTQPGYDIHSSPWDFDGPNRNRWFTVLNSMVIFHGYVTNNQMVYNTSITQYIYIYIYIPLGIYQIQFRLDNSSCSPRP